MVLILSGVVFVVVGGLIAYSVVRFRAPAARAGLEPPQVYGSAQIEVAWTAVPLLIVVVLMLATGRVIHEVQAAPQPPDALEVTVVGQQWWWEIRYPKLGIVTANELHVPVSDSAQPAADVPHPRVRGCRPQLLGPAARRQDGPDPEPDQPHVDRAACSRARTWAQCAEYCGTQHALMLLRVVVHAAGASSPVGWSSSASRRPRRRGPGCCRRAPAYFSARSCINCHAVRGTLANGRFGPDLTHLMSRQTHRRRRRAQHPRSACAPGSATRTTSSRAC